MNIEELKIRAIALEQELKATATQSADIAKLAQYEPLVSAIRRAKAGAITEIEKFPVCITGVLKLILSGNTKF